MKIHPKTSIIKNYNASIEPDNAFRICFSDPEQGVAMADYAVDTLGYKKIAVLYNVADEYSTGGLCIEFADGASERDGE